MSAVEEHTRLSDAVVGGRTGGASAGGDLMGVDIHCRHDSRTKVWQNRRNDWHYMRCDCHRHIKRTLLISFSKMLDSFYDCKHLF